MKTIIEFLDGTMHEEPDSAPSIMVEEEPNTVTLINPQSECISNEIPLNTIKRVVFEP